MNDLRIESPRNTRNELVGPRRVEVIENVRETDREKAEENCSPWIAIAAQKKGRIIIRQNARAYGDRLRRTASVQRPKDRPDGQFDRCNAELDIRDCKRRGRKRDLRATTIKREKTPFDPNHFDRGRQAHAARRPEVSVGVGIVSARSPALPAKSMFSMIQYIGKWQRSCHWRMRLL